MEIIYAVGGIIGFFVIVGIVERLFCKGPSETVIVNGNSMSSNTACAIFITVIGGLLILGISSEITKKMKDNSNRVEKNTSNGIEFMAKYQDDKIATYTETDTRTNKILYKAFYSANKSGCLIEERFFANGAGDNPLITRVVLADSNNGSSRVISSYYSLDNNGKATNKTLFEIEDERDNCIKTKPKEPKEAYDFYKKTHNQN